MSSTFRLRVREGGRGVSAARPLLGPGLLLRAALALALFSAAFDIGNSSAQVAVESQPAGPHLVFLPLAPSRNSSPVRPDFHTAGPRLVDASGRPVRLAGVNWYGFESQDYLAGGLDIRPYRAILQRVKELGFNTVRLPFSNEMVARNPRLISHLEANPELNGRTSLEIMDAIVKYAGEIGLWVILDNHRSDAGWSAQENGLWYTAGYPDHVWVEHWRLLAERYRGDSHVIGFDLRNEPHTAGPGPWTMEAYLRQGATWGTGDLRTDWRLAAERAGNAVLAVNPRVLIIVEGVQLYPNDQGGLDDYWWGGNLKGVAQHPVRLQVPGRLVYSTHDYGPDLYRQPWYNEGTTYESLRWVWREHWGYILDPGFAHSAPVLVGEFGTCNTSRSCVVDERPGSQGQWFSSLMRYIPEATGNWAYWPLNGTYSTVPSQRRGSPELYGLLNAQWSAPALPDIMQALGPPLGKVAPGR